MAAHVTTGSSPSLPVNAGKCLPATWQTRIGGFDGIESGVGEGLLSAYADLYGRIQRKLFAEVSADRSAPWLKQEYLQRYRIPARMFNAVRVSLEGKVASVREQQLMRQDDLQRRIARAQGQIDRAGDGARPDWLHQKRRRLGNLKNRLERLETDTVADRIPLCFGSRRLWRKQHHLTVNGYTSHDEWLRDWQTARIDEFFVLGSRDETAGCQLCVASLEDEGSLTLRLRLPDALAGEQGKSLVIPGVQFKYGHEQVLAALESNAEYAHYRREHGEQAARAMTLGQAISYRFKRDGKGWRVFVTTQMAQAPMVTDRPRGAIGVDLNADHLAVSETDGDGNWVRSWRAPLVTYGKPQHQAQAIIGDAVPSIVGYARDVGKPIAIEKLDFRQKKAVLEGESRKYSRMLSSFSYGKIRACFLSRGIRQGVEIHQVNPACSPAPEGHEHWTLRLLADKTVDLGVVESLSPETVRLRVKKTRSSHGRRRNGASPR